MMWKDSYRLGVERIDEQHKELFRMTEELIQAVERNAAAETYQKTLGFLKDYVVYHFRDEEAYQASIQYSGMKAHQAEHRQFTGTVLRYEQRLKENGFDRATMRDLAGTVTAWLIYHVVDTDQKIVSRQRSGGEEKRFIRCDDLFAGSALDVMETMSGLSRKEAEEHAAHTYQAQGEVFVEIGLLGDLKGSVVFGFSRELALNLVRAMTMMELNEVDELVQSALFELTNISCGNAASALTRRGLRCDITPPILSKRVGAGTDVPGVCLDTGAGRLELFVLLDDPAQQLLP